MKLLVVNGTKVSSRVKLDSGTSLISLPAFEAMLRSSVTEGKAVLIDFGSPLDVAPSPSDRGAIGVPNRL